MAEVTSLVSFFVLHLLVSLQELVEVVVEAHLLMLHRDEDFQLVFEH